jgi:hypothetical protein
VAGTEREKESSANQPSPTLDELYCTVQDCSSVGYLGKLTISFAEKEDCVASVQKGWVEGRSLFGCNRKPGIEHQFSFVRGRESTHTRRGMEVRGDRSGWNMNGGYSSEGEDVALT